MIYIDYFCKEIWLCLDDFKSKLLCYMFFFLNENQALFIHYIAYVLMLMGFLVGLFCIHSIVFISGLSRHVFFGHCITHILFTLSWQVYRKHRFEVYDPYLKAIKTRRTIVLDSLKQYRSRKLDKQKQLKGLEPIPEVEESSRPTRATGYLDGSERLTERQGHDTNSVASRRASVVSSYAIGRRNSHATIPRSFSAASSRHTDVGSIRSDQLQVKEYEYKRIRRKAKTIIMSRDRTIFPGECKSTYEMRKFMDREATHFVYLYSPEGRRQAQIDVLKKQTELPIFVDRKRTMSAILRDFKSYKTNKELWRRQ